jgi:hypothetical protein
MSDEDRRAVLESIAYGNDARVTPGDRLRALEQLRDLDATAARVEVADDRLTPEEALELAESWASAVPGVLSCARAALDLDPEIAPPVDPDDLAEVIELQERLIERLESVLLSREEALRRWTLHRQLSAAPEVKLCP